MPRTPSHAGASGHRARPATVLRALLPLFALLLLLVAACTTGTTPLDDASPGGDEPPADGGATYFVGSYGHGERADLSVAVLHVTDGVVDPSRPVDDAVVTLNGTGLTYDASRLRYVGTLPAALAPGAPVRLTVDIGDQRIEGSGTVPEPPTITGPAPDANFAVGDPVELSWDLAEDPDRYELQLRYLSLMLTPHPIPDGSARSFVLPASLYDTLPQDATPIAYRLTAHSSGTFSGPAHPDSHLGLLASTPAGRSFSIGEAPPRVSYHVEGSDMGRRVQHLSVLLAEDDVPDPAAPVLDLTGTVNGQALAYDAALGKYRAELPAILGAGERLELVLNGELGTVTAVGYLPERPRITAPAFDAELPAHVPVVVEWESPSDPDAFVITVWGGPRPWRTEPIPGSARSHTLPAAELELGQLVITLEAVSHGASFSGPASASSTMGIHHEAVNDVRIKRIIHVPDPPLP